MNHVYHRIKRTLFLFALLFVQLIISSFPGYAKMPESGRATTYLRDTTSLPVIFSFTPASGTKGTSVVIFGSHFTGTSAVRFGGTLADTFFVVSDSAIVARVGAGSSGSVTVTTPFGTASKAGFTFIRDTTIIDTAAPVIVSFTPTFGSKGSVVAIFGSHFTKTTAVRFGGTLADTFAIQSDSVIFAIVDTGSTGNVSVTTLYGTASKPGFTFIRDTTITDTTAPVISLTAKSNINKAVITNNPVSLYPNPASAYAIITHPATAHPASVQLVDLTGKVVRTVNVGSNAGQTKINTNGLVAGVYKVIWNNGAKRVTQTLLVK